MTKEDVLMDAMTTDIDLLYDLWSIANKAPTRCAEILIQFRDVSRACKSIILDLREIAQELKDVDSMMPTLTALIEQVSKWKQQIVTIDEDKVCNRINRLCEAAERLSDLKKTGGWQLLQKVMENT